MGGGGGRVFTRERGPQELTKRVREVEDQTAIAEFETQLSGTLSELLRTVNDRDTDSVKERLNAIKTALEGKLDGSIDQLFGGSVAKHTYVDGLSDIDSLLLLNNSELAKKGPHEALLFISQILTRRPPENSKITVGRMAVTVDYPDGMSIQLLPALRVDGGLKVPSSRRDGWSEIDPESFRSALTRRNEECAGKLVPTIKLAKAIVGTLPEAQRLSGYHMESLGIDAFRVYDGAKTTSAMLPHFFERAKDLVQAPIRDKTGQSIHVDDYLGPASSDMRTSLGHVLGRIAKRMRNASAAQSTALWRSLFGLDE